mgnify:CR=1 FL=1
MENTRRSFLKKVSAAGIGAAGLAMAGNAGATITAAEPQKKKTAGKDDGKLRFGFIGTGSRCHEHINNVLAIPGNKIVAICDIQQGPIDSTLKHIAKFNVPAPKVYKGGEREFENMLNNEEFDCVIIASPWEWHVPMSVAAMKAGVPYVGVEVSAANTIEECWDLVNTAEQTRRHCMMLENCCYDFFEMATLNMAQQGLFGDVMHAEGAYIHDLRSYNYDTTATGYKNMWRLKAQKEEAGNPYPTHGLGPVAQILNIHRGDRMATLVSMSNAQKGMHLYAAEHGITGEDTARIDMGDMNTTLIRTAKGKTIMIQHDVTSPRPYNRIHMVSGTKGFAQKYPLTGIALEPNAHEFVSQQTLDSLLKVYEHPFCKEIGEKARQVGGHGGMDFIMDYRLIHCLKNGLPLDMDVYDAAEWSCLVELTDYSVRNGSVPVQIPDFTRGEWDKLQGLTFAE